MRARLVCNRYTTGYRSVSAVHGKNFSIFKARRADSQCVQDWSVIVTPQGTARYRQSMVIILSIF